ncbi:HNH endonuclease [Agrococcus sp. BE272]|uniref:HNH endonuclease n=1 Tax=Agrococcus sp. BE272 TaxID=2817727 RepID=UPI00286005AC|nr:HNH endonuclease [Agrococcus sp. BE272]MDR7234034.1 putative restriction endonuclease [Agrococcus sp. BE272]
MATDLQLAADAAVREAVFLALTRRKLAGESRHHRDFLRQGIELDGQRIPLVDQSRGIWNPAALIGTLSVMTSLDARRTQEYEDTVDLVTGTVSYSYQVGEGGPNLKLRAAAELQLPIVYFTKVSPNWYTSSYPVYVTDDPAARRVHLSMERVELFGEDSVPSAYPDRSYVERRMWQRVHQPAFRGLVMSAYVERCAVCSLGHASLLDAAHIMGDKHELGAPRTSNGLALCKIHHSAFDRNMLGITPDYRVEIQPALLAEVDGPMLKHGIQEMQDRALLLPAKKADWPARDLLALKYAEFAAA